MYLASRTIQWVQLGVAVVGFFFTLDSLNGAWQDLEIVMESGRNGVLKSIAKAAFRQEIASLIVHLIIVWMAVDSLRFPLPTMPDAQLELTIVLRRIGWMAASLLLGVKSSWRRRDRYVLFEQWKLDDKDRRTTPTA